MDTVNVVAVTSDARPISSQFASWQEAADAVAQWSKDPLYLRGAVLVTVVMSDGKTLFKHDLDGDGKFGRDWQRVYMLGRAEPAVKS